MAVRTIVCLARDHRLLAARRRRCLAQHQQALSVRQRRPRTARSDSAGHAHHQHGAACRGSGWRTARPAGEGAVRLQLEPRGRCPDQDTRAAGLRREDCSPSFTSNSRPTPPTTPTSCCRRRRSSNTSISTALTATSTCRRTSRPSHRWARRRRTRSLPSLAAGDGFRARVVPGVGRGIGPTGRSGAVGSPTGYPAARHSTASRWNAYKRRADPAEFAGGLAPFAQGNFGTPSGKCELYSPAGASAGRDPLPNYVPPHEDPQTRPNWRRSIRCR